MWQEFFLSLFCLNLLIIKCDGLIYRLGNHLFPPKNSAQDFFGSDIAVNNQNSLLGSLGDIPPQLNTQSGQL